MMTSAEQPIPALSEQEIQKRKKIEKEVVKILKEMGEQVEFVLSSGPHHDYFLGQQAKKLKLKEMNSKYNNSIQSKLFLEIETGITNISKNKKSYVIEPKHQPTKEETIQKDKNEIKLKKKQAIQALNQILKQQNDLVKHQKGLNRSFTKSQLYVEENPEWKTHLKIAIKRRRQLERSLEKKTQQADNKAIQIKKEALKAKMERLQAQRASHLKLLEDRKQRQSIEKQSEQSSKTKCQQFVQKTKPKKYRFEIMSERGEQQLKILEQERDQKIKQYRQMRQKYDWNELKEHQSKYFETMSEKKQQWARKFQNSVSRVNKRHQKSIFAQRIQQQQNQRQLEQQIKQNRKRQFLSRVKGYGESVLQNHMPRAVIKSSKELNKEENKHIRHSLNRFQQRQKGLKYLNDAKHQRRLTHQVKNNSLQAASSLPAIKRPQYKDYLRQQPKRAKEGTFYTVLTEKKGQWASNAKSIIQRIDVSSKKDDKKVLESAFKKIELLKAIM